MFVSSFSTSLVVGRWSLVVVTWLECSVIFLVSILVK